MNVKNILSVACIFLITLPMLASAEIYKWRDKNGVMRYSDTPPPVSVKVDTIGKTGAERSSSRKATPSTSEAPSKSVAKDKFVDESRPSPEQEAAKQRARNAETERRNKMEQERMAKLNKENCKAAKANYQTFAQGGRIYKTNEQGEREYYGDDELRAEKLKAQREMKKFCK